MKGKKEELKKRLLDYLKRSDIDESNNTNPSQTFVDMLSFQNLLSDYEDFKRFVTESLSTKQTLDPESHVSFDEMQLLR